MLSLQDEISDFEKLTYNKELGEFVALDQMFLDRGVTIESLIKENSFIVQQVKKISSLFRNYCRLNEKVYHKMVEHELNSHCEQEKIQNAASHITRLCQESVREIKQLRQQALDLNVRNKTVCEDLLAKVEKDLDTKVDKVTFETSLRKFSEYQGAGELPIEGGCRSDEQVRQNSPQSLPAIDTSASEQQKRTRWINVQQFKVFASETKKALQLKSKEISDSKAQVESTVQLLQKTVPLLNKNIEETASNSSQLNRLHDKDEELAQRMNDKCQWLLEELNTRVNQQVWHDKFYQLERGRFKPKLDKLHAILEKWQLRSKIEKATLNTELQQIHKHLAKHDHTTAELHLLANQHLEQMVNHQQKVLVRHEQLLGQIKVIDEKLVVAQEQQQQQLVTFEQEIQKQIEQQALGLRMLSSTVQESVLKIVSRTIQTHLKQIDIEQRKSYLSQKEHGNKLTYCLQEIEHIKDILAKKANFTDVVLHVDRKADREDVKELELRFSCPKMNVSNAVINRAQRTEAVRNKPRESRTVMHTTPIRNRYKLDLSSKIFMCGGDDFVPSESRQLFSQNSKRKSLKTTTACGNDFTL